MCLEHIEFLWVLLILLLLIIWYFMSIRDHSSLFLLIIVILVLSVYTKNMIIILFISLLVVCSFNILSLLNIPDISPEYHIFNRTNLNDAGTSIKEYTPLKGESMYPVLDDMLDIQQIIYNWNKSTPIID